MSDNIHKGHRQRMREKFTRVGEGAFHTYELLEMMLYYVIPYKDTNPIAQRLIKKFGSLSGVFSASIEEIASVEGIGLKVAEYIKTLGSASEKIINPEQTDAVILDTGEAIGKYCAEIFSGEEGQATYLLTFDGKMRLLCAERVGSCDLASCEIRPEKIALRAVRRDAVGAVLVHSHPYGALIPSEGDRVTAKLVRESLSSVGVELLLLLIVSGDKYSSFSD